MTGLNTSMITSKNRNTRKHENIQCSCQYMPAVELSLVTAGPQRETLKCMLENSFGKPV